jgi:hypothetical protein
MMKFSSLTLIFMTFSILSFAEVFEDVFSIDRAEVEERFTNLSEIEEVVKQESLDVHSLEVSHPTLLSNPTFKLSTGFSVMGALAMMDDPPLGIPSFLWGMCLGLPGLAVVYFVTEDDEETKKALWGCLVSVAVYGVLYVLYILLLGSSFWWAV